MKSCILVCSCWSSHEAVVAKTYIFQHSIAGNSGILLESSSSFEKLWTGNGSLWVAAQRIGILNEWMTTDGF